MASVNAELAIMEAAARAGGRILSEYFAALDELEIRSKGPADFVSAADLEAEAAIRAVLLAELPEAAYRGEETEDREGSSDLEWVVDPLDGTTNFVCGVPHFAVSIALRQSGRTICGLVYQPVTGEAFAAARGKGATRNGEPIHVSGRARWDHVIVATGVPHRGSAHHQRFAAQLAAIRDRVGGIRRFGAAALDLAYVAWGRFDGFWEQGLKPWDVAAGNLLVAEAGGLVTGLADGHDPDTGASLIAASPWLYERLAPALRGAESTARVT